VVAAVAFSPDGKSIVSAGHGGVVRGWDLLTGRQVRQFSGDAWALRSVGFSPDGKTLVAEGDQIRWQAHQWDVASGKLTRTLGKPSPTSSGLVTPEREVRSFALSPDGKVLARSAWSNHVVRLTDLASGRLLRNLPAEEAASRPVCTAFTSTGEALAVGSEDASIRVYDVASGKVLRELPRSRAVPICLAFSPDDRSLAVGGKDGNVRLLSAATGKEFRVLRGHQAAVRSALFTPDGKSLITGSTDRISLWDARSGKEVRQFRGHDGQVCSLALSPNGKLLAGAGAPGSVYLWRGVHGRARPPVRRPPQPRDRSHLRSRWQNALVRRPV
jgi:WD40 repeat protein